MTNLFVQVYVIMTTQAKLILPKLIKVLVEATPSKVLVSFNSIQCYLLVSEFKS